MTPSRLPACALEKEAVEQWRKTENDSTREDEQLDDLCITKERRCVEGSALLRVLNQEMKEDKEIDQSKYQP